MTRSKKPAVIGAVELLRGCIPAGLQVYTNRAETRVIIRGTKSQIEITPNATDTGETLAECILSILAGKGEPHV